MLDMVISAVGVILFSLLTAYDTQKIKMLARELIADDETIQVVALRCALVLYLDFINLFLYLLRFMGKSRNNQ
jgi:FtsH-binding integral membrane protein